MRKLICVLLALLLALAPAALAASDFASHEPRAKELAALLDKIKEFMASENAGDFSGTSWGFEHETKKISVGMVNMSDAKIEAFLREIGGKPEDFRFYESERPSAPPDENMTYSSISLQERSVTLTVRQTHPITIESSKPEGAGAYQMTCESSNPKIAAVEEGNIVRGIAPGSATITVKAKNGKAKATLRVKVVDFNKKLRFYDAEEDAAMTTRKAPVIADGADELWIQGALAGMELEDIAPGKYGKYAVEGDYGNMPSTTVESAGGELYYAALYTLMRDRPSRNGYVVLPERYPGCSETAMAEIRTWLRESFDGIVIGMLEDYDYNWDGSVPLSLLDLYEWGGTWLSIGSVIKVSDTRFLVDVSRAYADQGYDGHRALLERTENGWRYDGANLIWIV